MILPLQPKLPSTPPSLSNNIQSTIPEPNISSFKLNIGTINCRGLRKTSDANIRKQFIRYLRTTATDILTLQETHADTEPI